MREESKYKHKILTLPNLMSFFRLLLIPCFVYTYTVMQSSAYTAALIVLSGLTDVCDGYVARHWNMVSDLGKILDPIADKLTQAFMLFCLLTRFPYMLVPLLLLAIKEIITGILSLIVIKKTSLVMSSDWHGKLNTVYLYAMMLLHIVWSTIPSALSNTLISLSIVLMLISFLLYILRNIRALSSHTEKS